jgi:hypothetical protein
MTSRRAAAALLTPLALLIGAAPAAAEVITVTTEADGQGECTAASCTLRAALAKAEENDNQEPDTIVLPTGEYLLSNGALYTGTTNRFVTIRGAGADKTVIRGDGKDRLLEVGGESVITIEGVTFAFGRAPDGAGGNIFSNQAALFLREVRVTAGSASRGAGVAANGGNLVIERSTIDANHVTPDGAGDGGGVLTTGNTSLIISDSSIIANTAANGGALASDGNSDATTRLTRVTIAYNQSTNSPNGAIASFNGSVPARLSGTLIARNQGKRNRLTPLEPSNCSAGGQVDEGGNLETGTDCGFTRPDSRQGVAAPGLAEDMELGGGTTPLLPISATSPARDLAGACTGTDQRGVARPQGAACDAGAYEYVTPAAQPQPQPQPTPVPTAAPTPSPAPTPVPGKSVVAQPRGTILVRLPASKRFVRLREDQAIPLGSTVNAKRGRVVIIASERDRATFFGGIFRLSQSRGLTTLTLTEKLAPCPKRTAKRASAAAKKPKKRRLWGDGKGKFRTKGRYSAATVRGTRWLVQDSCAGTLTRVTQGSVTVRDGVRKKTVIVRKGKRYLARPKR